MFDKKNAAKKTVVDYALSPEGKKLLEKLGIFRWTNKGYFYIKKGCLIRATFFINIIISIIESLNIKLT
jgi:hypothetical protein